MPGVITLHDDHFVARGGKRKVFHHPLLPDRLIKVMRSDRVARPKPSKDTFLRRFARPLWREYRRFGPYQEWCREHEEYISIINRIGRIPDFVAGYHGFVETNRGPGLVVEKITDPDGRVAPTLRNVLHWQGQGEPLATLVEEFFDEVVEAEAILKDMTLKNFVLAGGSGGGPRLVAVDALSDPTVLRIKTRSRFAYRRWAARRRRDLLAQIGDARVAFAPPSMSEGG